MTRSWSLVPLVLLVVAPWACADLGKPLMNGVKGTLSIGPGVVFIERGPLHHGTFERAGLVSEDGTFFIELESSGAHGFHAYIDPDNLYLPIAVDVQEGVVTTVTQTNVDWDYMCDRGGNCEWVEQSTEIDILTPGRDTDLTNNPVATNPVVRRVGPGIFEASLDVEDPDGDLSVQVLVHHIGTGIGQQMNPPGPVIDGRYPNGHYTVTVFLPEDADDSGPWQFIAADHGCSNSELLTVDPQ